MKRLCGEIFCYKKCETDQHLSRPLTIVLLSLNCIIAFKTHLKTFFYKQAFSKMLNFVMCILLYFSMLLNVWMVTGICILVYAANRFLLLV